MNGLNATPLSTGAMTTPDFTQTSPTRTVAQQQTTPSQLAITGVHSAIEGRAILEAEIDRARRYERPLSVVVIDLPTRSARPPFVFRWAREESVRHRLAHAITSMVRGPDVVALDDSRDCVLLVLPETTEAEAQATVERLRQQLVPLAQSPLRWGVASFPTDAMTARDMIGIAQAALTNEAVAPAHGA